MRRRDMMFGSRSRVPMFGSMNSQMADLKNMYGFGAAKPMMMNDQMAFGKKRRVGASKKVAMKAFRSFYKRHCAGRRGMGFGYGGGNPPLNASMGYEFCPSGMGGVLGVNSTGLFPSPCTSMDDAQAALESALVLPTYSKSSSFGLRRRRRSDDETEKAATKRRRRRNTAVGGVKRRSTAVGTRRRTAAGVRKRRCTAVGTRRRTAAGVRRRRRV
jgi:hypothetical protein